MPWHPGALGSQFAAPGGAAGVLPTAISHSVRFVPSRGQTELLPSCAQLSRAHDALQQSQRCCSDTPRSAKCAPSTELALEIAFQASHLGVWCFTK